MTTMRTTSPTTSANISYEMFEAEARAFFALSQDLLDEWELKISPDECQIYLSKVVISRKIRTEYHIIYSVAFGVPVLYFRRFAANGEILWDFDFVPFQGGVSQMPHPFFQTPFYQLHPCHTEKWMKDMRCFNKQVNYLVSWLSFIAPHVGLNVSEKYALELKMK